MCQSLIKDRLIAVLEIEAFRLRQRRRPRARKPGRMNDLTTTIPKENTMSQIILKSALAGAMLLSASPPPPSPAGEYNDMY